MYVYIYIHTSAIGIICSGQNMHNAYTCILLSFSVRNDNKQQTFG